MSSIPVNGGVKPTKRRWLSNNIESRTLRPLFDNSWNFEPLARDTETPAKALQKSISDHHYSNSYSTSISPLPFPPPEIPMSSIPVNGGGKRIKWIAAKTFKAADTAEFRQMVSQLSGVKSNPISLPFVPSNSKKNMDHNHAVKVYTRRDSMEIEQLATLAELGTDPENEGIISDLLRFARDKDYCKSIGKAWKRGYLFNDSPGTDRSSLIAAMANRLEFDVHDLDLTGLSSITELTDVLVSIRNRSLIAIKDFDHWVENLEMLPNLKSELTLSGLLKIIRVLLRNCCGDEQIIVITTNHNHSNRVHATLLHRSDIYIHTSSPQPIAVPDGREIVQLDSSEQKPLVDYDATTNRVLVSYSEEKNTREGSRRQCMTKSELQLVDSTTRISSLDFDDAVSSAHLMRAYQSGPILFNSEKKDTGEGLIRACLTKTILSLDDSSKKNLLPDVDATENKAHLVRAYQSGHVASLSENKNGGEALKRESITESILGLEDLQQNSDGRRGDAAKSFGAIYDPGIPMTDSLSQKSFEGLETLLTQEEPNDCVPLLSVGRLTVEGCTQEEKSPDLPTIMQLFRYLGGLTAQSASSSRWPIGLPDGRHVLLLDPVEQSTKNVAHAAKADQCSPTVSLPEKKMVRKTLKRECRTMNVIFEIHQQHFGRRCEGIAKSLGRKRLQLIQCCFQSCSFTNHVMLLAKDMLYCSFYGSSTRLLLSHPYSGPHVATGICRKHGINRVSTMKHIHKQHEIHQRPFHQKWAIRKGYSVGDERPFEVSSDEKLDSMLQFILMSQFARSSPRPLALPDGGQIFGPTALSSSEFAVANNRAHLVGQDKTGSIASHYERKNTRETSDKQGLTMILCSVEDLEQHFGCKHKVAVKSFGVSLSMFKSTCRQHLVYWWRWRCRFENNEQQAFDATNNRAHLVKADESSPTVSNSEKGSTREAFKRDCLTNALSLEDLRQHFGARRKDLAEGLRSFDSLAWKSFEVLDSLPLGEQSNSIRHLAQQRTLTHKHCVQLKKSPDLPRSLQRDCPGGLAAQSDIGLPDGGHILSLSEEKIVRKTLKRKCRTMSVLSIEDHQQRVGSRWEDDVKFLGAKRICRQLAIHHESTAKRIRRQHGTRRWPFKQSAINLPDGGLILYLSKKEIVRKTLKRKCRTMSVLGLDYHQHVNIRWEDAVKSLGAKRIRRQLVIHRVSTTKRIRRQLEIHQWLFQRNWASMKGHSLGDERPFEVMSLSADWKLVSRLQRIHISWIGRFAPRPSALPGGGEIVGPITLSSSEFASTNNKAQRFGQDKSGSAASDSKKKRREQEDCGEINTSITLDDLRQHYGHKRKDVAESLGVSVSTLKRTCRQYGIKRWPNIIRKKAGRPPDQHGEKILSPTGKTLSTNGQNEMENEIVGHLEETNEFLLDFVEGPNGGVSSEWAFELRDQWTVSTSYPNSNGPEVPHPHIASTQILRENMGSLGDRRNSFGSLEEHILQGHNSGSMWTVPPCSDPASGQHMPTITPTMGSSEDLTNSLAFLEDDFLEEDVSGSISWTIPTCFEPAPSQLMPSVPRTSGSSDDLGNLLPSVEECFSARHVSGFINGTFPSCSYPGPSQPMSIVAHTTGSSDALRNLLASVEEPFGAGHVSESINLTVPSCFDPAASQFLPTIPHTMPTTPQMMPLLTGRQDMGSVRLKAIYGNTTIKFHFPLLSGFSELKEEVSKRLEFERGSFKLEYKDEEGDSVLIGCDEDVRDYLRLLTSLGNQVIKLFVLDKVPNTTNSCDNCRSLKCNRP